MSFYSVKFHDNYYVMAKDPRKVDTNGFITTLEAFQFGDESYAHLNRDGTIRRYQKVIGSRDDITVLEEINEPKIGIAGALNLIGRALDMGLK